MQVSTASLAANIGLKPNDFLNSIAGQEVFNMTHDEVKFYFIICFYVYFYVINKYYLSRRRSASCRRATGSTW